MKSYVSGSAVLISAFILSACSTVNTTPIAKEPEARKQEVQCYQEFSALQKLDPAAYEGYRKQFENINKTTEFMKQTNLWLMPMPQKLC